MTKPFDLPTRPKNGTPRSSPLDVQYAEADQRAALFDVQMLTTEAPLVAYQPATVYLDFEQLSNFDRVDSYFQQWGVSFGNAIALRPSNPAFPPRSGKTVLMSHPHPGCLEVKFCAPVQSVSGYVTSSQRLHLVAFDAGDRPIAQTGLASANLARPGCKLSPNQHLRLQAPGIYRLAFYASGGQLTLDDFSFQWQSEPKLRKCLTRTKPKF